MRLRNSWRDLTSALKHSEEQQKIDHLQKQRGEDPPPEGHWGGQTNPAGDTTGVKEEEQHDVQDG